MTHVLPETATLIAARAGSCPLDPPAELAALRAVRPLSRARYPDGHEGWLVTDRALARAVLADPRFSIRPSLMHMPVWAAGGGEQLAEPPADQPVERPVDFPDETPRGVITDLDPPDHTGYRRLLTGQFTVRRMRQLTANVERITAERLDVMERHGPPLDLVRAFAQSVPALTICELLGVPYERREEFQRHAMTATGEATGYDEVLAAFTALSEFMHELVRAKRAEPTDDLMGGLVANTELDDVELANIGAMLLGAGLDTTANMLSLGTLALLQHPEQLGALHADPEVAVEELLRYLSIIPFTARSALEDVELDGQLIAAGDTVTISVQAANRDPAEYADPDTLDLRRSARSHVSFGHGIHQCLGQQLARVEMRVAFPALFARFPTLRLTVEPDAVPLRTGALVYGAHELPVTWDL